MPKILTSAGSPACDTVPFVKLPELLRRYYTCARCGKTRHRRHRYWNGREYICDDFDFCDKQIAHNKRMDTYWARDEKAEFQAKLERRRAELRRQLGASP